MKKLVIVSDSHGNMKGIEKMRPLFMENDYVIHLGDGVGDMRSIWSENPEKVYLCSGNCDFFAVYPEEGVLEIEGLRIFYCHGHKYRVKSELYSLAARAKAQDCQIALYGHTHQALISEIEGVMLINPGSLRRSVGEGGSYCYLVINKEKATPVIVGQSVF